MLRMEKVTVESEGASVVVIQRSQFQRLETTLQELGKGMDFFTIQNYLKKNWLDKKVWRDSPINNN